MRTASRRRQAGQTAAEYLGIVLVVAAVVAAVATSDLGGRIAAGTASAVCRITGGECANGGRGHHTGPRGRNPRATSADVPPGTGTPGDPDDVPIPGPADPPPPGKKDGGAGPYDSKKPSLKDRALREKYKAVAAAAEAAGLDHAAANMRYYLDRSGKRKPVDPADLLRDIKPMRDGVQYLAQQYGRNAYQRAMAQWDGKHPVAVPFRSPWTVQDYFPGYSKDWLYAMGAFSYSVSGVVRVDPPTTPGGKPRVSIEYQTNVFDRYNWDTGKSTNFGPVNIKDTELQRLHRTGLAREYEIAGSSGVTKGPFDPSKPSGAPPPKTSGGDRDRREGGRPAS